MRYPYERTRNCTTVYSAYWSTMYCCSISVVVFRPQSLSLWDEESALTLGFGSCRRAEITVSCEEHTTRRIEKLNLIFCKFRMILQSRVLYSYTHDFYVTSSRKYVQLCWGEHNRFFLIPTRGGVRIISHVPFTTDGNLYTDGIVLHITVYNTCTDTGILVHNLKDSK